MPLRHFFLLRARRGFTLTELTIVLIIIGVIVGSLFTQIADSDSKAKENTAYDQLNIVLDNVRAYYRGQRVPTGLPACPTVTNLPAGVTGIFPAEMGTGANTYNAWNVGNGGTAIVYVCGTNRLAIRYTNLTTRACISMVTRVWGSGLAETRVNNVVVPPTPATGIIDPVTAAGTAVIPRCSAAGGKTVDWYYRISG